MAYGAERKPKTIIIIFHLAFCFAGPQETQIQALIAADIYRREKLQLARAKRNAE
jgi:hypothetical protein